MAAAWDAVERLPSDFQPPERTETLLCIGRFYYFHDMAQPMIDVVASAVRAAVLGGHRFFEMQARAGYGVVLREAQDFVGSMRELGRALDITREMGSALEEAKILNSLANTYSDAGLQREALLIFERAAACFEANNEHLSAWMTLDNAALAALRLGDIQRGIAFSQKARLAWDGEPKTADEQLWVVQGAPTNCELLIHTDRTAEAVELAQAAKEVAAASGLPQAETLAMICVAITNFATGAAASIDDIDRVVQRIRREVPAKYPTALEIAIRTYERTGHFDKALLLQRELLALTKERKFEAMRQLLGRPSPEETDSVARIARLEVEVQRQVKDLGD